MFIIASFEEPRLPVTLETFAGNTQTPIKKFDSDRTYDLAKAYLEAPVRLDFINPFFQALGRVVENKSGLRHHEREVLVKHREAARDLPPAGDIFDPSATETATAR